MRTHGLVLGKFLPPHAGHRYLINFAQAYVDELSVVVGTLKNESIPGALRHHWMSQLFPQARVLHLQDENPQDPSEHPDFWNIWRNSLQRILPSKITHVFASEAYGARLATELGATFIPVDIGRQNLPISGTQIRQNPWAAWSYLPPIVRPYFLQRICVFGPESTGKSKLANNLAKHYKSTCVSEYARTWLEHKQGQMTPADIEVIARGQLAAEEALAPIANRRLFCDTDLLTTHIWSNFVYGSCPDWITTEAQKRHYDLTLLLDVDVPYVDDIVRYLPDERRGFFERCEQALIDNERPYVVIQGNWQQRFAAACDAIDALGEHHD